LFFDFFIGVFLWLGFWLKLTLKVIFNNSMFSEPVGFFDGSSFSFDNALLVSTVGMAGLLLATLIRRNFFSGYFNNQPNMTTGLEPIYSKNRVKILSVFIVMIVLVGVTNFTLGIYQKGTITRTFLPFGFNGVYKWLLLFGMTSLSALILDLEFRTRKNISLISFSISILETFFSSISMLSRGMILNSSSLIFGLLVQSQQKNKKISPKLLLAGCLIFLAFFLISQQVVGILRTSSFFGEDVNFSISKVGERNHLERAIFIDRWVGMEGVMSVSSYPSLGAKLFEDALHEKYNEKISSFYDENILTDSSPYVNVDKSKHHFLSLPGIIAFLYYTGSYVFLFSAMCLIGGFAATLEVISYKLTNNLILVSLMSQVVAYRFSNFGYVPSQSYLLFFTIFANILFIYMMNKYILILFKKSS
jgi:hypothetical protein